jgi:hypothetical protein
LICQFEPNEYRNKMGKQTNTIPKQKIKRTLQEDGKSNNVPLRRRNHQIKRENPNLCEYHFIRLKQEKKCTRVISSQHYNS